jgi:cobalamin biosynthesis protein CobD/CbiB
LGVELEKIDHYRLGAGSRKPASADIRGAGRILFASAGIAVGLISLLQWYRRKPILKTAARQKLVCRPSGGR